MHDIDTFVQGMNDYIDANSPEHPALHRHRHLRPQRLEGPVRRRGRRRRGAPLAVPRRAREAPRHERGLQRLQRPAAAHQRRQPDDGRRQVPLRASPRTSRAPRAASCSTQGATRTAPAAKVSGVASKPRRATPGEQRADDREEVLEHRPPATRRRPADRLLLPRLHLRDRHARRRPQVAGRDLGAVPRLPTDRPRQGLRVDAHVGRKRRHRPVRGDALRRQRHHVPLQRAPARRWARSTPARSTARP